MTTLRPYSDYRESGADWIGKVPRHWSLVRLKNGFTLQKRPADKSAGIVTAFRDGEVTLRSNRRVDGYTEGDKQIGYQTIHPGDLVIHAMDAFAGAIGVSDSYGQSTPVYSACTPKSGFNAHFYGLTLRHIALTGYILSLAKGVRERSTDFRWGDAKELPVPCPPIAEQNQIVEYVRRETGQIDQLIAEQERLIELLVEKRQAIITQAVIKGLNSFAPAKPSGTPWLRDIPAHWSHCQLKQASIMVTDGAHVSPETENGQYDFVSTKDMGPSGIDFEGSLKTSAESYRSLVLAGCQPQAGDLLFSKDGTIGRTTVINENREFVVASSLIIIRPNSKLVFNKYLDFVCQSRPVQSQVSSYTKGAGLPRLSIASLRRVRIPLPPLDEQMDIAENLTVRTSTIDYMCQRTRDAIGLLKERRSALISAAVTGKIDVRKGAL